MKKAALTAALVAAAVGVSCGADGETLTLRGEAIASGLHINTWGKCPPSAVVVSQAVDHAVIDIGPAKSRGLDSLTVSAGGGKLDHCAGRVFIQVLRLKGNPGDELTLYFEGQTASGGHWFRPYEVTLDGTVQVFRNRETAPVGGRNLHVRFDLKKMTGPLEVYEVRAGHFAEFYPQLANPGAKTEPKLLFSAPFDGTAVAVSAAGDAQPRTARGLAFAAGRRGQALRMTGSAAPLLEYAASGNLDTRCGSVAFWFCRSDDSLEGWRPLFSSVRGMKDDFVGSGNLNLWFWNQSLRADVCDDERSWQGAPDVRKLTGWHFYAMTWDACGIKLYVDGKCRAGGWGRTLSPMWRAYHAPLPPMFGRRRTPDGFSVGSWIDGGGAAADGLIDEFRIWDAPLTAAAVDAMFAAEGGRREEDRSEPKPDYERELTLSGPNPHVAPSLEKGGLPGQLELVEELVLDEPTLVRLRRDGRFVSRGPLAQRTTAAGAYLENGSAAGDRWAIRFALDDSQPLYCLELDYPDDAKRTMDILVQKCTQTGWDGTPGADYTMQVGVMTGDEYANSGKMLTHRCLYWTRDRDVALIVNTARDNVPAAVSRVRLFRVVAGKLPAARVCEPPPNDDGWRRTVALYYEDPAIEYDFSRQYRPTASFDSMLDRIAAYMKYCGQNALFYPGAWYSGVIGGKDGGNPYNPRQHAIGYREAFLRKFDRDGLAFVPTINQNQMAFDDDLVNLVTMEDGSLHPTAISIHDTGTPNQGGWHDSPPNYNIFHPSVRKALEDEVDLFIAEGVGHPSFKGVCLHLTRHCLCWWGTINAGYNDYVIEAFERDTGVRVPVDRSDPLRGKDYARWLKANAYEKWVQWRCDYITRLYASLAQRLKAARPDLKLYVNSFCPPDTRHPHFTRPDFLREANRESGLDGPSLSRAADNVVLCQTMVPADVRKNHGGCYPTPEALQCQRTMDMQPGFYSLLEGAGYPWVNQHDRYWESPLARTREEGGQGPLAADWLKECRWRVGTINPPGRQALRHFVEPFKHRDVLGVSKGGYLVGTYGMEDVLVPFVQAFRALPAVVMSDIGSAGEDVRVRGCVFRGRSYFYVVNAGANAQSVSLAFPKGTVDLVTGRRLPDAKSDVVVSFRLEPYELRSFSAPAGQPRLGK